MYCTNCGTPRPPGATSCPNCTQPFAPVAVISNYLVPAILVTLCCCMPFGIVALIYSVQVNTRLAAGDVAGAQASSGKARTWCWFGLITGILTGAGAALLALL